MWKISDNSNLFRYRNFIKLQQVVFNKLEIDPSVKNDENKIILFLDEKKVGEVYERVKIRFVN